MKEPFWQKVRCFLAQPLPQRRSSTVATWIEWRCRSYRVQPLRTEADR